MKPSPERTKWIERYRAMLPIGTVVYCVLESVARSGMSRCIVPYAYCDGEMRYLGGIGHILGLTRTKRADGFRVHGCGMDMGFHLVSELARAIHGRDDALQHRWL